MTENIHSILSSLGDLLNTQSLILTNILKKLSKQTINPLNLRLPQVDDLETNLVYYNG